MFISTSATRRCTALLCVALVALSVASCDGPPSDGAPGATRPPSSELFPSQAPVGDNLEALTRVLVDAAWEEQTEHDKKTLCESLPLMGPEVSAQFLLSFTTKENPPDWEAAGQRLNYQCKTEGYA